MKRGGEGKGGVPTSFSSYRSASDIYVEADGIRFTYREHCNAITLFSATSLCHNSTDDNLTPHIISNVISLPCIYSVQFPFYAERDIVLAIPSVHHIVILYL